MPIQSINPSTEEMLWSYPELSPEEVKTKIAQSQEAFLSWKNLSYVERAKYLSAVAKELRDNARAYAEIETKEMGMPITASIASVEKSAWNCEYFAEQSESFLKPHPIATDATKSYVRFDPLGIIMFVMPWNFPYWQVFRQAAPTLMAGNTILLKHASNVPESALACERAFRAAGVPEGVFQTLLVGSGAVEGILSDTRVKGVSLTGSVSAGKSVAGIAGREVMPSVMELGGSDPFIVLADADIEAAAKGAALGRLINCGQSCIASKRFIVVESVYDAFISAFKREMETYVVGDAMDATVQVGPMVSERARAELHELVEQSVAMGAQVLLGGKIKEGIGYFYEPTILVDVTEDMPVFVEETFGPVAPVLKAKDTEDAILMANNTRFGLGASLWTADIKAAEVLARGINAGMVFINSIVKSDPRLPFGGINEGGYGREVSEFGIKEFVNMKTVWVK
jgi:succinate-semialdehyde dehydrogenase/glutarate-semialdehyde dehydrogenase